MGYNGKIFDASPGLPTDKKKTLEIAGKIFDKKQPGLVFVSEGIEGKEGTGISGRVCSNGIDKHNRILMAITLITALGLEVEEIMEEKEKYDNQVNKITHKEGMRMLGKKEKTGSFDKFNETVRKLLEN